MTIRILIAEDNQSVRSAMRSVLEESGNGWRVSEASNGMEAIEKAQELKPNLIILDLVMPAVDGLVAAQQITKLLPETPILMHTMYWSPPVEFAALKAGVRKVVPKSESNTLVAAVEELLPSEPDESSE